MFVDSAISEDAFPSPKLEAPASVAPTSSSIAPPRFDPDKQDRFFTSPLILRYHEAPEDYEDKNEEDEAYVK